MSLMGCSLLLVILTSVRGGDNNAVIDCDTMKFSLAQLLSIVFLCATFFGLKNFAHGNSRAIYALPLLIAIVAGIVFNSRQRFGWRRSAFAGMLAAVAATAALLIQAFWDHGGYVYSGPRDIPPLLLLILFYASTGGICGSISGMATSFMLQSLLRTRA